MPDSAEAKVDVKTYIKAKIAEATKATNRPRMLEIIGSSVLSAIVLYALVLHVPPTVEIYFGEEQAVSEEDGDTLFRNAGWGRRFRSRGYSSCSPSRSYSYGSSRSYGSCSSGSCGVGSSCSSCSPSYSTPRASAPQQYQVNRPAVQAQYATKDELTQLKTKVAKLENQITGFRTLEHPIAKQPAEQPAKPAAKPTPPDGSWDISGKPKPLTPVAPAETTPVADDPFPELPEPQPQPIIQPPAPAKTN